MAHSFLLEPGYWKITGHWLKPKSTPIPLQGGMQIAWKRETWFKLTTSLVCDDENATKIIYQCRGNLNYEEKNYTYVSQHNLLGNIEGEGRLGFQSIIQYYWFIEATSQQKGLDTYYCVDSNTYHLTSSILDGHSVKHTIEAVLKR
ncbi:hypothetical protein I4641_10470 [Waterburya agarophytonicola K14]|uniref:Uncharacterized protein n=1 Tax=Waterburya agarophytonicola KI4 TaxID=2874699 RepID=A0A964FF57_9CYAN|nr:hypothetical protein [Waterburya agarophytonicola]MCC0177400.1 hypothetical protein [Waterburya agarophytonicola KI4]